MITSALMQALLVTNALVQHGISDDISDPVQDTNSSYADGILRFGNNKRHGGSRAVKSSKKRFAHKARLRNKK